MSSNHKCRDMFIIRLEVQSAIDTQSGPVKKIISRLSFIFSVFLEFLVMITESLKWNSCILDVSHSRKRRWASNCDTLFFHLHDLVPEPLFPICHLAFSYVPFATLILT